jgi:hypothetical protein
MSATQSVCRPITAGILWKGYRFVVAPIGGRSSRAFDKGLIVVYLSVLLQKADGENECVYVCMYLCVSEDNIGSVRANDQPVAKNTDFVSRRKVKHMGVQILREVKTSSTSSRARMLQQFQLKRELLISHCHRIPSRAAVYQPSRSLPKRLSSVKSPNPPGHPDFSIIVLLPKGVLNRSAPPSDFANYSPVAALTRLYRIGKGRCLRISRVE